MNQTPSITTIKRPSISVVMPVYNSAEYLAESIESILTQSYNDFEFIIIDDGSTDRSWSIIQEYAKRDERIVLLRNDVNLGIYTSRNRGLSIAQGRFIAVMDSDDISLPDRFKKQISYLTKNNHVDILGTQEINIDEDYQEISVSNYSLTPGQVRWDLIFGRSLCHPSLMMRGETVDRQHFYNQNKQVAQDYEILVRMSKQRNIANLPEALLLKRKHKTNISKKKFDLQRQEAFNVIRSNILSLLGKNLSDEVISGLITAKHQKKQRNIESIQSAWEVSSVIIKLMRKAMDWEINDDDLFYIRQNTASRLRRIWREQKYHPVLLPYVLYSLILDPGLIHRRLQQLFQPGLAGNNANKLVGK